MSVDQISLSDAVEFVVDNRGKTVPVQESGFPLIATNCISNENLYPEFNNVRYVSNETYENWFRAHPKADDVILTNKGSKNGAVCLVPSPVSFCIAQDMVALRAKKGIVYPRYLFAVLRSSLVQSRIKELNVDSVIPHFKKTDFNKLFFPLPSYEEQKLIGDTYYGYCQKVELNRQTNQTLEHIAQALFKSWFVDFEPTRAKIAAKQAGHDPERVAMAAISGKTVAELDQLDAAQLAQLKTTAALFPDGLVESELGEVPEGWCTEAISEWGSIICGKTPSKKKKEYYGGQIPFIKIPDMHASMYAVRTTDTLSELGASSQPKKLLPIGSVCVSCIATVGKVVITNQKAFTNQQINSIIPNNDKHTPYLYFTMLGLNDHLHDLASGGSATLNLNTGNFSKIDILRPSDKALEAFAFLVKPMLSNIMENCLQEANLASLRNTLLPKLLSGELSPTTTEVA